MSFPSATVAWPRPPQPPAYSAVNPRTTLQPVQPQVIASPAPKPRKVDWSPAVREYVRRAFDSVNVIPGISSIEMQTRLKTTISYYAERNAQEEINWATYPLPQQLIQEERRKAAMPGMTSSSMGNGTANTEHPRPVIDNNNQTNPTTPHSKKRKSQGSDESPSASTVTVPPWEKEKTNLASRMTFDDGDGDNSKGKRVKKNGLPEAASKLEQADLEKRRQRFQLGSNSNKITPPRDEDDNSTGPVVGTNQSLEKSYFRLTAPPKPETVRPLHVLEKTLAMLVKKWKTEKNYNYICNQFKSLRQDLTVQHVKNAFTVKVYEIHARIALEKGDLGEYNQCQTQLKALYAQNLGGNPAEFKAYRILYFVYTCNKTDMNDMLAELTLADKAQRWIKHALDVRSSLALGNYHKFFRLYLEAQNMGAYLMDMFIERERLAALANISRGYAHVTLRFLTDELGFDNDESCCEFLASHGAQNMIEEKAGQQARVKIREAASQFEALRAAAFSKVDIKGQI